MSSKLRMENDGKMNPTDKRVLLIVLALFLVTSLLDSGPLRSYLETYLVLSFVPGLLTFISISELVASVDPSSFWFYVRLLWIMTIDRSIDRGIQVSNEKSRNFTMPISKNTGGVSSNGRKSTQ